MAGEKRVRDYVTLIRGITYKGDLVGKPGPALLGLGSIHPGGGFREGDYKTYGGDCPPKLTLAPGDLFVSLKGATKDGKMIGSVARVPVSVTSGRLTQDTVKLEFRDAELAQASSYLYWLLRTPQYRAYCEGRAMGSAVVALSRDDFLNFPVPLFSDARKGIVEVLECVENKIELNRRMNATLEAMARALFQSWFVDFDPVRAKRNGRELGGLDPDTAALFPDHLEDSTLGNTPKGWQVQKIREVVEEVFDGPHATPPNAEEGPIFLGIKNLTGSALDLSDIRHISESNWPRWTKRVTPKPLDIVFSYEATLGYFALIPPGLRCCLGRRLALIRPRSEDGHPHFWFHQFIGPDFQRYLMQHSVQGATVDRIPLIHFPNYFVLNPPSALKEAFECRVAPLWAKIHSNAKQSRTLATLRDTLLPKLLSGALRIN
jgi:type I restriction enzyme S subunit